MKLAERDIVKLCTKRWDALGLLYRRVSWIGRGSAPDFVVMGANRITAGLEAERVLPAAVWVETKRPGATPRPDQDREHERMRNASQVVAVIATLEDLDRWFPL